MNDLPFWMGLAPLLGFLLDALFGGTRIDEVVHRSIWRALPRMEFAMKQAFRGRPERVGYGLLAWFAGVACVGAWLVSVVGWTLYGAYGLFVARALLFLVFFSARGLTMRGIEALVRLSSQDFAGARAALSGLPGQRLPDEIGALCGGVSRHLSAGTLGAVFVPLFWGLIGGAPLAAAALAVHIVAETRHGRPEDEDAIWAAVARVDSYVTLPAAWLGGLVVPVVIGVVGGRRSTAFAGFVTNKGLAPGERLASAR